MPLRILCVCSGNTCRSPMLEEFLLKRLDERGIDADVESTGVHVSARRHKMPIACMRRRGIDIREHRSRHIDTIDFFQFDIIIAMMTWIKEDVEKRGYTGPLIVADISNPASSRPQDYEVCAKQLEQFAEEIVSAL